MRQTQSRKVLVKLLMRIKVRPCMRLRLSFTQFMSQLTEDLAALRQIMRLPGFSVMTNILEDYSEDVEIKTLVGCSYDTAI